MMTRYSLHQVLLGAEVVVEQALGHAHALHDVLHRGVVVTLLAEQLLGRLDELVAPLLGVLDAPGHRVSSVLARRSVAID